MLRTSSPVLICTEGLVYNWDYVSRIYNKSLKITKGTAQRKATITKDIVPSYYDENGILTMNIYDFLLGAKSLEK